MLWLPLTLTVSAPVWQYVVVTTCENVSSFLLQYATALEKNKLFVKNLPFTCSVEALEKIFSEVEWL